MKTLILAATALVSSQAFAAPVVGALSCQATNALGVAKLTLDPQTQKVTSVINGGVMTLEYALQSVTTAGGTRANSKNGEIGLKDTAGAAYLLSFNAPLHDGDQTVTGTLNQIVEAYPFGSTISPISFVDCTLSLVTADDDGSQDY